MPFGKSLCPPTRAEKRDGPVSVLRGFPPTGKPKEGKASKVLYAKGRMVSATGDSSRNIFQGASLTQRQPNLGSTAGPKRERTEGVAKAPGKGWFNSWRPLKCGKGSLLCSQDRFKVLPASWAGTSIPGTGTQGSPDRILTQTQDIVFKKLFF